MRTLSEAAMRELADYWYANTGLYSMIQNKLNHPVPVLFIELGESAVPFILGELRNATSSVAWPSILSRIVKDPPKVEEDITVRQVFAVWLKWGEAKGYLK